MKLKKIHVAFLMAATFCVPSQATEAFDLIPSDGILFGGPGDIVGWGFSISSSPNFMILSGFDFTQDSGPLGGVFTDFTPFFTVDPFVGPPPDTSPLVMAFDNGLQAGVGSFAIPLTAVDGDVITGTIELIYFLFSVSPNDPSFDPGIHQLNEGGELRLSQDVEIQVVPEPSTFFIAGIGLMTIGWRLRRRI